MSRFPTPCILSFMRWPLVVLFIAGCSGQASFMPDDDAGAPLDSGVKPTPDSGAPYVDAGQPVADAGTPDAGHDAGTPYVDAGTPYVDAGTVTVAWNGESVAGGAGWSTPSMNTVMVQSGVAHEGSAVMWGITDTSVPWNEWGWNWKAWQKPGTDISGATTFAFYLKLTGNHPPGDMTVSLRSALTEKYAHQPPPANGLRGVSLQLYESDFADGQWHQVKIPLSDMLSGENAADFAQVYEVFMGAAASDYQLYLDDIEFW